MHFMGVLVVVSSSRRRYRALYMVAYLRLERLWMRFQANSARVSTVQTRVRITIFVSLTKVH